MTTPEALPLTASPLLAAEINALPDRVRAYIHHLISDADPAGDKWRLAYLEETNAALLATIAAEKARADAVEAESIALFHLCINNGLIGSILDVTPLAEARAKEIKSENTALAAQVAALSEAVRNLYEQGRFDNGVTDPTGSIDEGVVMTGKYVAELLANLPAAAQDLLARLEKAEGKQRAPGTYELCKGCGLPYDDKMRRACQFKTAESASINCPIVRTARAGTK